MLLLLLRLLHQTVVAERARCFIASTMGETCAYVSSCDACGGSTPSKVWLLAAVSTHDFPEPVVPSLQIFRPGKAEPEVIELPSANHSDVGSIAVADADGDGDLDVFVAGRGVPGRFPNPASSWLLRCGPDGLKLDTAQAATFANVGMVTAAVFVPLDADPLPELVLIPACVGGGCWFPTTGAALGVALAVGWAGGGAAARMRGRAHFGGGASSGG